jgi:hypothetical protein
MRDFGQPISVPLPGCVSKGEPQIVQNCSESGDSGSSCIVGGARCLEAAKLTSRTASGVPWWLPSYMASRARLKGGSRRRRRGVLGVIVRVSGSMGGVRREFGGRDLGRPAGIL